MIAHVTGVPVEETLLPLLSTAGAGLLLVRAWVGSRVQRRGIDRGMSTLDGESPGRRRRPGR